MDQLNHAAHNYPPAPDANPQGAAAAGLVPDNVGPIQGVIAEFDEQQRMVDRNAAYEFLIDNDCIQLRSDAEDAPEEYVEAQLGGALRRPR
jgi:hypothetical protein